MGGHQSEVGTSRSGAGDASPGPTTGWMDRFVRQVSEPDDAPEMRLRRTLVAGISLTVVAIWLSYGSFYVAIGARGAAWIAFATAAAQALLCALYLATRSYPLLSRGTNALALLALLAVHLALGGFTSSGYVLIYAMTPLFLATALEEPRYVRAWMAATVGTMLLAGVGELFVTPGIPLSPTALTVFTVFNIVGFCSFVLVPVTPGSPLSPAALTVFTVFNIVGFCSFVLVPNLIHGRRMQAIQQQLAAQEAEHLAQTQAALRQQTATAEVLQVISSSVADAAPVFEKIIQSCETLFGVDYANVVLLGDDGLMHLIQDTSGTGKGPVVGFKDMLRAQFPRPARDSIHGYALHKRQVLHYPDILNGPGVPEGLRAYAKQFDGPSSSALFVPMFWEGKGIGTLAAHRTPPRPFGDSEINLLRTFADQAAIAIQNARLFNETQEALEQQRASADVLRVISRSVADTAPVFEAIGQACQRLFASDQVVISLVGDDDIVRHAATVTSPDIRPEAAERLFTLMDRDFPRPLASAYQGYPIRLRRVVHYPDFIHGPKVPETMREFGRRVGSRRCCGRAAASARST